jgi:hypothetical protein
MFMLDARQVAGHAAILDLTRRMVARRAASKEPKAGGSTSTPSAPPAPTGVGTEAEVQQVTAVDLPQWMASFVQLGSRTPPASDAELLPLLAPSSSLNLLLRSKCAVH